MPADSPQPITDDLSVTVRCAEVVELLTELLDDALSDTDRQLIEQHLAGCEHCRIELRHLQLTVSLIAKAGRQERQTRV